MACSKLHDWLIAMKTFKENFVVKESRCSIISDSQNGIKIAEESIKRSREELEKFVFAHPKFAWTLSPFPVPSEPLIAKLMAEAAEKASVGPMASVAGVIADLAVKDMIACGCKVAIVENGGEVSAFSNVSIDVALAVGDEPLSRRFGFRLTEFPVGVATSSGRFSHAFSFGNSDAVTVFCKEAGLADAAATAVGNLIKGTEPPEVVKLGINFAKSLDNIYGVLILFRGHIGTWGKIPQIIKINQTDSC
jgi:uncharacterized protein